jgi:hypothetical protein
MASLNISLGTFGKPRELDIQQPKDVVTPLYRATFVNGKMTLKWNKSFKAKKTERFISAQEWLDNAVLHDCEPYIPLRAGILIFSGILSTKIGSGTVSWTTPYARYLYYGKVMVTSPFGGPKILTKRNLKFHGGGKRGAFWFERTKEVKRDAWRKGVALIAAGGR